MLHYLDSSFTDPEQANGKTGEKGPVAGNKIKSRTEMKLKFSLWFRNPVLTLSRGC